MSVDQPEETAKRRRNTRPTDGVVPEPQSFAPPALADEASRVSRSPVDVSAIPGWGVDADESNNPTWPMRDRAFDDAPGRHWQSPEAQPEDVEVLMSIEHTRRPAVFGTASPPSGLSGEIRRVAFNFSESRWTHWLLLLAADRINMVEGVLEDFGSGKVPNLWKEFGLGAEMKHNREAFIRRTTTVAAVAGVGLTVAYLLKRRRRRHRAVRTRHVSRR